MATNKDVKKAVSKAGQTLGHNTNLSKGLASAVNRATKTPKTSIKDVKSYKEYLDMTPQAINKLSRDDLRTVVARLNKVESKRIKNLEKYGAHGQALRGLEETGGRTRAAKDMTRQQLLHEYKRAKSFLMAETSTVSGAMKYVGGIQEQLGATRPLTKDEIKRAFDLLHKYEESGAIGFYQKGDKKSAGYTTSMASQKDIFKKMNEYSDVTGKLKTDDEILAELGVLDKKAYEAQQDTSKEYRRLFHHP